MAVSHNKSSGAIKPRKSARLNGVHGMVMRSLNPPADGQKAERYWRKHMEKAGEVFFSVVDSDLLVG